MVAGQREETASEKKVTATKRRQKRKWELSTHPRIALEHEEETLELGLPCRLSLNRHSRSIASNDVGRFGQKERNAGADEGDNEEGDVG